jgi:hypothetical protein
MKVDPQEPASSRPVPVRESGATPARPAPAAPSPPRATSPPGAPSVPPVTVAASPAPGVPAVPILSLEAPPVPEVPEELDLSVDGVSWRVRVQGRSNVGSRSARAPLLLLGFHRDPDQPPERESWIVAHRLVALSELELEAAFRTAKPPQPAKRTPSEASLKERKEDG